ncbi:MAG: PadR family transcriptional regulator [Defluviitaleaceae bacterium]|nr:PadR family transcriptional regulator [Defluviitaleaceae bacterium]
MIILNKDEILSGLLQEMRRGTIILCVLAKLRQAAYGYNLVTELAETGMPVEANTLYPLLRRLESQGLLSSHWNTTDGAKPRKYYATTDLGKEILAEMVNHWWQAMQNVKNILED